MKKTGYICIYLLLSITFFFACENRNKEAVKPVPSTSVKNNVVKNSILSVNKNLRFNQKNITYQVKVNQAGRISLILADKHTTLLSVSSKVSMGETIPIKCTIHSAKPKKEQSISVTISVKDNKQSGVVKFDHIGGKKPDTLGGKGFVIGYAGPREFSYGSKIILRDWLWTNGIANLNITKVKRQISKGNLIKHTEQIIAKPNKKGISLQDSRIGLWKLYLTFSNETVLSK